MIFIPVMFPAQLQLYANENRPLVNLRSQWLEHNKTHPILTHLYILSSFSFILGTNLNNVLLKNTLLCQCVCSFFSDYYYAFTRSIWKPVDRTLALFHFTHCSYLIINYLITEHKFEQYRYHIVFICMGMCGFIIEKCFIKLQIMTGVKMSVCMWHYLTALGSFRLRYTTIA